MKSFNIQKTLFLMTALNILLTVLIIFMAVYVYAFHHDEVNEAELFTLPVISLLPLSCAVMSALLMRPASVYKIKLKQTEELLDSMDRLHNTLRAQRHDFINHLQVVHSLIEIGEHSEANDYIDKVYSSIEKVSSILKTGIPAVNAILEAKRQSCENRGIDISVEVSTPLSEVPIPAWELCRLFGNIIDNSINALTSEQMPISRWINVEIFEDIHSYRFIISNNGPTIPQQLWDRIFDAGYTTRVNEGEGMGLAICKEIMNNYNGKLWVISDEYETVFEGFIPKETTAK